MLVLVIDTSSAAVTAAVASVDDAGSGQRLLAERVTLNARGHGEHLAPGIAACLAEVGAAPGDLAAIVAGTGPGPFTGLRVGLVTAAVMGDALGIPTYGVCSLDGIASAEPGGLLVATDARRKEVYWAHYDAAGARSTGPEVSKPATVPTDGLLRMAGAGARLYQDVLGLELVDCDHPNAVRLVTRAAERITDGAPSEVLTPLYLRRPDAVEPHAPKAVLH